MSPLSASGLAVAAILTLAAYGGDGNSGSQSALGVDDIGKLTGQSAPLGRMASAPLTHVSLPSGIAHCTSFGLRPKEMHPGRIGRTRTILEVSSAGDLARKLSELDYSLREVRLGVAAVPRLRVANLPPDMAGVGSVAERKRLFIMSILPLVLQVNEGILADRRKLLDLAASDGTLTHYDRQWIAALAKRHGVDAADRKELVVRVDAVPPSLAIAQAIVESGWGRSRFAVEANAIFGQWTFRAGSGVVPRRRDRGKGHEIRSFRGPYQSVAAYMDNLNSHRAYEEFRRQRNALRRSGEILNGGRLAGTLHNYSQRGQDYVETIRTIMRQNRLADFDRAHLVPDFANPAAECLTT